jgi:hypothetical protein
MIPLMIAVVASGKPEFTSAGLPQVHTAAQAKQHPRFWDAAASGQTGDQCSWCQWDVVAKQPSAACEDAAAKLRGRLH